MYYFLFTVSFGSLMMSKVGRQLREIVANVVKFMTEEAKKGVFIIDAKKVIERVNAATGVSKGILIEFYFK